MDAPPDGSADALPERPAARLPGLSAEVVGKDYVFHDERTGQVHFLNEAAALVLGLCDGHRTRSEIVDELARLYDLPAAQVSADVVRALASLMARGLVGPPGAP